MIKGAENQAPGRGSRHAANTKRCLKEKGVFQAVSGILVGKPMDEVNASEYERALVDVIDDPSLPIVTNVNVGHAQPRCIIPFGPTARVDACNQVIRFD